MLGKGSSLAAAARAAMTMDRLRVSPSPFGDNAGRRPQSPRNLPSAARKKLLAATNIAKTVG